MERVVKGNIIRRIYDWVMSWGESPYSQTALFFLALAEASFFPVPPDVLLITLGVAKPKKSFIFATICTAGSMIGAVIGYLIGWQLWHLVENFFFTWMFSHQQFQYVSNLYNANAFLSILTAAFTPIPFKVFTITAGVFQINFGVFLLAALVGRSMRFFLVSALFWKFGAPIKDFIDRYFNWATIAFTVLLIGGFALINLLSR